MDEGDRAFGTSAWGAVDELEAVELEPHEGLRQVRDLEADVVEPLPLRGEEPGDTGRVIGRFDELDLRLADGQERDPYPVGRDVHGRLVLEPELVPPEAEGGLDRGDDHGDVMDLAETADPWRNAGHRDLPQTVISSRCSPQAPRSRSLISPTVAYART